jgi:aminoglycoside 2'-N-acetyltransferase I
MSVSVSARVLPTARLEEPVVEAVRRLCDAAFGGTFSDDDWLHALGGHHVLVEDGTQVVAHAAVVPRELIVGERPYRTGYVEAVATAPARQREGLGTLAMRSVDAVLRRSFAMGGLSTGEWGFYEKLGWERWRGPTYVRDGVHVTRTSDDDGSIMVLRYGPSAAVDLTMAITCTTRAGDVW